eukprot:TRINITY_DN1042_c0_g2_i1.p1 TRINITY_DN1042_c0_g2~~TRINITY_DN1042_c0_g2_i1.p1  ORF type:complete len:636 (+),score=90.09 TRINITY_DN1042_c0_g2_i1:264-1910(+)
MVTVVLVLCAVGLALIAMVGQGSTMQERHSGPNLIRAWTQATPPLPTSPDQILPFDKWLIAYQVQKGKLMHFLYHVYQNHPTYLQEKKQLDSLVQYQIVHDCPKQVVDSDFKKGVRDLQQVPNIHSAGECQKTCTDAPLCVAWSWGALRDAQGISDVCFLKQSDVDSTSKTIGRSHGKGMVGGLPCNRSAPFTKFWWAWDDRQFFQLPKPEQPRQPEVMHCHKPLDHHCEDAKSNCCAPLHLDQTAKCSGSYVPVRQHGECDGSHDGKFTCCPAHEVSKPKKELPTVHCLMLFIAYSAEQDLLVYQHEKKVGIFQCDSHAIYSSQVIEVAPGLVSRRINHAMKAEPGGQFLTVLNLGIFLTLYRQLILDKDYLQADWIVKVDPDTMFFADRLRRTLSNYNFGLGGAGMYLNNCPEGLHGPIEVFSQRAFLELAENAESCYDKMNNKLCDPACQARRKVCNGKCVDWWGEDIWADRCLDLYTKSQRVFARHLLQEDHCPETAAYSKYSWKSCKDTRTVAFHPFKTKDVWEECLHAAQEQEKEAEHSTRR